MQHRRKSFFGEAVIVVLGEDPDALGLNILQVALEGGHVARHVRKVGKSKFSLKFRRKTPAVGFKVEVSGETLIFKLKV